jgi:hypothetical protein
MPDARQVMGFKLYPRGFVGGDLPIRLAVQPKPYEIRIRAPIRVGVIEPQRTTVDANLVIETLYSQYIKRSADTQSFEFRESVLIAALAAFGSRNFFTWYQAQLLSPACGEYHLRFLGDTCRFLMTGQREMRLETWSHLLKPTEEVATPAKPCESAAGYFCLGGRAMPTDPQQFNLVETIQRWVSHPQGLEDLLGTLHLLFGNL